MEHSSRQIAEKILGIAPGRFIDVNKHLHKFEEALGVGLGMVWGKRFARMEKGRVGVVPVIGSRGRAGRKRGSVVVGLHGCIMPIVLERRRGIMFGESVTRKLSDATSSF